MMRRVVLAALSLVSIGVVVGLGGCSAEAEIFDLRQCLQPLSCDIFCWHISPGDCSPPGTLDCGSAVWTSGDSGLLVEAFAPGPGGFYSETAVFLKGDGTALSQHRSKQCPDNSDCDLDAEPFVVEALQQCNVVDPITSGFCDDQTASCDRWVQLEGCVELATEPSCALLE